MGALPLALGLARGPLVVWSLPNLVARLVTPTQVEEKEGEVGDTQVDGRKK